MIFRRTLLLAVLGACGYRGDVPAQRVPGRAPQVGLTVAARSERQAQLLRDYLDAALTSSGAADRIAGVALRLEVNSQQLMIRRDETPSRGRLTATAQYVVAPRPTAPGVEPPQFGGYVRSTEGYNFVQGEYFATDSSREAAEQRLMREVADQIARRIVARTF
ncbi:MAG: hypothetical protein IT556_04195 [Acetobacteraceae bacterium]|nr:hypothetical protein [Acetobacteraceae bacterium]